MGSQCLNRCSISSCSFTIHSTNLSAAFAPRYTTGSFDISGVRPTTLYAKPHGYAGGGHYNNPGSGAEYVCLPPDPDYVKTSGLDYGRMYGAEFDSNFFASNANDEDVPCALCRTERASSVIMIPGKNKCYSGWKEEYHGYLASGGYSNVAASAFVCVDINPEYIIGGVDQHLGKLFFEVLTKCGSLKCPPYINNYPLTCVVDLVTTEEKRLLLNDLDVMNNRLNRMEGVVAILNATVRQLTSENHQQLLTNQQQDIVIQQQQTSIQQQEQTIKLLQNSFNSIKRYAAGGNYGEAGSAAEYVCLPPDPNYVKTSGLGYGHMYGAEFYGNFFASNAHAQDVPCASCRTTLSTSVIMIPGKNTCYNGWREEYHGYLSSGAYYHAAASAYLCVDINPEYIIGGVDRHLGKLFFDVLTKCGSLKCPPYINNYPLTCVVCSK
ncbi:Hypothetical predicted protein [Mytilus galloprovincialis]|uniref:Uncharacterized protein n=1 Tax=Mytilus galloprovincialis TaxID=29158 RepID=A0A8B6BV24_MYTGA|nr:Hypothetical predicted protein [Mytilus galloprovincialis]